MHRRFLQNKISSPTVLMAAIGIILLAAALLPETRPERNDDKQAPRAAATQISLPDPSRDADSDSANLSLATDIARLALFPGAKSSEADKAGLQRLAADFLDDSRPLKLRRQAAWALGKLRSPEAFSLLRQGLPDAPAQLKAAIAEVLGNFDTREARELLRQLLKSDNETVARGALRGWAAVGDNEALQLLGTMFIDSQKSADLRAEAALSLAKIKSPGAYQILVNGLNKSTYRELATTILAGLGERPFSETQPFFQSYLARSDVPTDLRIAALEALGHADSNAGSLLVQYLDSGDSRVRAASAWALAMLDNPPDVASRLWSRLQAEENGEVRIRIYQALETQSDMDNDRLLASVLNESLVAARVAGLKLLATQVARQNAPSLNAEFDRRAVPELEKFATGGSDLPNRLISVMALKQAMTPGAIQALSRVAAQSTEPRIAAAAKLQ
jgi:HEAT repeat protein